jgi:hypothetical protein
MILKKDSIPLIISFLLIITSIGFKTFTNYQLNYKHYIAIVLVTFSAVLYFKNKRIYKYLFGITLFAGAVDLIDFFFINVRFSLGPIDFNLLILILLFIFLSFNKQLLDSLFPDKKPASEEEIQNKKELKIQHFEQKFENKSASELKAIINTNNPYVNEARIAADRIMKKKYNQ